MKLGDKIGQADGTTGTVRLVKTVEQTKTMYNLDVANLDNFYVGEQGWLVHNTNLRCSLNFDATQLQKKFKHASDFGVTGNFNKQNAVLFEDALANHVVDPFTVKVSGEYAGGNGNIPANIFYNTNTGNAVVFDTSDNFISGWTLSSTQTKYLLTTGRLGGGR